MQLVQILWLLRSVEF